MKTIILQGKSMKGKNRVREHGSVWTIHAEVDRVLFNPEPGPWLYVSPVHTDFSNKASRWIKKDGDLDFLVDNTNLDIDLTGNDC